MKKDINELKRKIEELYQKGDGYLYVDNGVIIRVKDNSVIVYDAYFRRGWMSADAEVIAAMVANWYLTQLMLMVGYDKTMTFPSGGTFTPSKLEKSCPLLDNLFGGLPESSISLEDYQEAIKKAPKEDYFRLPEYQAIEVYNLLVEKGGDRGMWLPTDWKGWDTLLENNWFLTADYFINTDEDMPNEENICSITGEIYIGKGYNAYPFYGRCSYSAYAKYVKKVYLVEYSREQLDAMKSLTPEQRNRKLKEIMDDYFATK